MRPSRRAGSGEEALLEGQEWSGGPSRGLGVVSRLSQRAGSGQNALPKGRKWLGGPSGGQGVFGGPP